MAGEDLILAEKDRAKLDGIVQQMTTNGESEDDISFVVNDFKQKYGQKKSPSVTTPQSVQTSTTNSGSQLEQPVQPSNKNGAGYQWSSAQQPTEELATGGTQGEGTNVNQFLPLETSKKVGTKKIGTYLFDKNMEVLNGSNEIESANTIQKYLDQSGNYQMYVAKKSEYDKAVAAKDLQAQQKIKGELDNIMSFPLVLISPEQDSGVIKPTDEKLYNTVPAELKKAKTVGDAIKIQETLQGRKESADAKIKQAQADIDEVVTPLRSAINFDLEESGYNEYGIGEAFMRGILHTVDKVGTSLQLLQAKDDNDYANIVKEKLGTQNVLFPSKATEQYNVNVPIVGEVNPVSATETAAGLLPYFATGSAGTVGSMVANSIMMGATGYADGALRGYEETMRQTNGDERAALEASKKMSIGSGIAGVAVGGLGLPAFGVAGEVIGSKTAGVALTEGGIGELTIPQYLKYTLPKNAVSNLPFALQTYADNKIAQASGLNRPSMQGVSESLTAGIFIGSMIDGLHYGGAKLDPKVKSIYQTALAKFGFPQTVEAINKQVEAGVITKEEANNIIQPIQDKAGALAKIDADLPIATEAKVLPIVEDINKLEIQKEKTDPAFHSKIDAELEKKRMQVAEETGAALTEKERKEYEKIVEKKNAPVGEGKEKTELLPTEKEKLEHYEKRIEQAGKNEANKIAQEQGFDSATHLLNSIEKSGLGKYEKVQDIPEGTIDKLFEFPLPEKPLSEMTAAEVRDYSKKVKQHERNLGKIDESKLTKEQADKYFGRNLPEGEYDPQVLEKIANRMEGVEAAENAEELAQAATPALLEFSKERGVSYPEPIIKSIAKRAKELNVSPEEILKEVRKKIGKDIEPADRDFLMQEILKAIQQPLPEAEKEGATQIEQNATQTFEQQKSLSAERESGSEVGQAGKTSSSDSLQRETPSPEERQVEQPTETTPVEKREEISVTPEVKDNFAQITDLFYKIREASGSSKKRSLKEQRDKILEENPSIKYIDDNISSVMKQLEDKGLITKKGDCP